MNPWDIFTWTAAISLSLLVVVATVAVVGNIVTRGRLFPAKAKNIDIEAQPGVRVIRPTGRH